MLKRTLIFSALILVVVLVAVHLLLPPVLESSLNRVEPHDPYVISPRAQALHDTLFIADLHTDSLLWARDLADEAERGHVDLPRLRRGNVALQVFSATTKSPRGQNYERNTGSTDNITALAVVQGWPIATWTSLHARADYQLRRLRELAAEPDNRLILVRNREDLQRLLAARAADPDTVGAMYLIEGAHPLEGKLENLDALHEQGLHFVGLTHFFDNRLGGSLHGTSGQGLTEFGRAVVARAEQLGMTIDVAHASPAMVRDVLAMSKRPVVLSHGGFRGHCDTPRNLDDALMQAIAAAGGLVGVGYWEGAVCDASPAGIAGAIRYGIELLGVDHIALGSDYDGTVKTHTDTSELAVLTQAMLDANFSETEIRAVMGGNVLRFLREQLP